MSVLLLATVLSGGSAARAVSLVQEFFLPMPEQQIYQADTKIETSGVGTTFSSIFSVVITGDGTVVYYDQWEDGYEVDLANPVQSSTKVWGDGNDANGIPPGFAHDPAGLPAGTVITLTNNVPLPRNPSTLLYDARDRIASTKALVISRAGWPSTPGPVFGGAVGVESTIDYGTSFVSPVGQDMTNKLFQYVGVFVMAAQDGTTVTIDPDGAGPTVSTNIVLNRGESYLYNGGIKKGGTIVASKPVQTHIIIGHIGGQYASDWFNLTPVSTWDNTYYTPVPTSASGNPAYVYLYNANNAALTINYSTRIGSGSFSIPATNVFQYAMPQASGAKFASASGSNFFAICTVAANNNSDSSFNWGFTLVPKEALTTEAVVGWGPGSSDNSVDGSPAWITPVAATTVYVDYNGDRAGPVTDPKGNKCDTNYTLAALESKKIFDPDKDQTAMRIYTVDGTLITGAWGEDPDTAQPGNPYIDAGTTILPFPVPTLTKTATIFTDNLPLGLSTNDVIEYTVTLDNKGLLPLGNTVVIDAPSANLVYVSNTASLDGTVIPDSTSGTAFPLDSPGYTIPVILRSGSSTFKYHVRVIAPGTVSNSVNVSGSTIAAMTTIAPTPASGATSCALNFTDSSGTPQATYQAGGSLYVTVNDGDQNTSSNTLQSLTAVVRNNTRNDLETITLTETGTNTGIFRNSSALATSLSSGLAQGDGTLNVQPGDILTVTNNDATFGDTCNSSAVIATPSQIKVLYLNGTNAPDQTLNRINPAATPIDTNTAQTVMIGLASSSSATIALVSTNTVFNGAASISSMTLTNVAVTGVSNRLLLVSVGFNPGTSVTGITLGNQALSLVQVATDSNRARQELWRLLNPNIGTSNVVVTFSGTSSGDGSVGAVVFSGVDQTTPFTHTNSLAGNSTTPSITVTSAVNEVVYNGMSIRTATAATPTGSGQVKIWQSTGTDPVDVASTTPGAATVTSSWTATSGAEWASVVVSIKPATVSGGAGGGTNFVSFVQTTNFCSGFSLPAGGTINITNFITLTNGTTMPANPAITAQLKYGATTLITLTNPVYTAASSNLVWSGTLAGAVTIPSGQAITYTLSNAQAGVSYLVNYGSVTKPSKILLPTTTVISVSSVGVYDAPYPGGSLVQTPTAGQTLYIRTAVADPFGSYDVTSLGLTLDGPGTSDDVSTTLTGSSVVDDDGCTKTYEYVWHSTINSGTYNIAVVANEGSEGITDTATASVLLMLLDLGTPSITEFTSGNNGTATNAFPGSSSVCVRVTDLDQNLTNSVAENLAVTVTSSSGDSENVTLTETTTNSGIFTGCLSTSTNLGTGNNNGTLLAPPGSLLTVSYTDPNDSGDQTSANATILTPAGTKSVIMNKTLVSPTDGQAATGDSVTFNLQVVNSGSVTLTNLGLVDTYPATNLVFSSASVAPNTAVAGTLTWTSLGNFTAGQTTNILVNFIATNTATLVVNTARVASVGGATNTGTASLTVTRSALTITKTVLSPTNFPVGIGTNVTFRIVLRNSGTTSITNLPLQDTFSGAVFQFVSATVTPDGSGSGSLLWNNLGPLAAGSSLTNDVLMKAIGAAAPAQNTAEADFAVDSFGNLVPPSISTASLTNIAASITGSVINDTNRDGLLTAGEVGISGVTISIYTDPNHDGDPGDGALVKLTTTAADGSYDLLNLSTGAYVVVESDPVGFSSVSPVNNRRPVTFNSLVASNGVNFFDYQPNATNYSTIGGRVFSDVNGNGTNDVSETGLGNVSVDLVQDVNTNGLADSGEPVTASATTDTNGFYTFVGVLPGNYVVRETDPSGYYSTGDSQPPNDNFVKLTATPGLVTTNNSFFDHLNTAPVANNDTYSGPKNVSELVNPLTNDTDADGNTLTITSVSPTNGSASAVGGTNVSFFPTLNFVGAATIGYSISDGHGGTSAAVITLNITNRPPVATNDLASTAKNVPATLSPLLNDTDPDNDLLSITLVSATNGTAGIVNGTNVLFTPATNFLGTATVGYTITDGSGTSSAVITISVTNRPPVAVDDSYSTSKNLTLNVAIPGVLTNDVDPDGDALTALLSTNTAHGALTLNGSGSFTYVPVSNYFGSDTFAYRVTDGSATSGVANVTISIGNSNTAPVAVNDFTNILEDASVTVNVLTNDFDADGDVLTITNAISTNGTVTFTATNVVYTPSTNFNGTNVFTYVIVDGHGGSATGLVTVAVAPVNDAPTLANCSAAETYTEDTSLNLSDIVVSDVDSATVTATLTLSNPSAGILSTATSGAVTSTYNAGTGVWTASGAIADVNTLLAGVTYNPATNFNASFTIGVSVTDGIAAPVTCSKAVTGIAVNDPPTATNLCAAETYTEDTSLNLVDIVVADVDSSSVTVTLTLSAPAAGSLSTATSGPVTSTYNAGTGVWTASGAIASVNTLLAGVTFTPATNYNLNFTIATSVSDGIAAPLTCSKAVTGIPVNDAPIAVNDTVSTLEDTPVTINALTNDIDVDGDALTITNVTSTNGIVSFASGTNIVYTPSTNFNGTNVMTYVITDGHGGSSTGRVFVVVSPVNDAPVAVGDNYSTFKNQTLTVPASGVLTNDFDVDGDALSAVLVATTTNGVLTLNTNGSFTYVPTSNYFGADTFTYRAFDGTTNSGIATVNILVGATNTPPVAVSDTTSTLEDTPVIVSVLTNDFDVDGDALTITNAISTNGTVSFTATNVVYTPSTNFNGTNVFSYVIIDGHGGSATGLVTVAVISVNDAPVALNDVTNTLEDVAVTIRPLLNDSDVDGGILSITNVVSTNGAAVIVGGTNILYTPSTNFNGTNVMTYTITDGQGGSASANITVAVTPVNDAPVAVDDVVSTLEDTPVTVNVLTNDFDVDLDALTITNVNTTNGSVTFVGGTNIFYTPSTNFHGTNVMTYVITDGHGGSATGHVFVTVVSVNDAPVANNDNYSTFKNQTLIVPANGVLTNDTDADNDALTALLVATTTNGTLTFNGNGSFTYVPNSNYFGADTFTYRATDGQATSAVATVSILIGATNTPPVAVADSTNTLEDTAITIDVLTNDFDVDGDVLTITNAISTNGTVSFTATNVVYTPSTNFFGTNVFSYVIIDGHGGTATGRVTVAVSPVNDAPTVANCSAAETYTEDTPLNLIDIVVADVDSPNLTVTLTLSDPAVGTLSTGTFGVVSSTYNVLTGVWTATGPIANLNGLLAGVTYNPATNYNGNFTIGVSVSDGVAAPVTCSKAVTGIPVNDAPVAVNDATNTPEDTAVTIDVLANDSDVDGDSLSITNVVSTNGIVTFVGGTNITYTPSTNFNGTNVMTYTITDGNGGSATAKVTVVVTPVNDAPIAVDDTTNTLEDVAVTIKPLLNDSDADHDALTITNIVSTNGLVSIIGGTNILYTPSTNFNGTNVMTYTITDGNGGSASANIFVVVAPVNDAPVANDDTTTTPEDTAVTIDVLTNDTDVDFDTLTITNVVSTNGTVTFVGGTNILYTPSTNFNGTNVMTYTITDGHGGSDTATVIVVVTPVNDAPNAVDDNASTPEDVAVTIKPLLNDTDADHDALTITDVSSTNGLASIIGGTNVLYTPSTNFNGTNVLTYTISDGNGGTDTANITVVVTPVNDAPVAVNDVTNVLEDAAITINALVNDFDVDLDALTITNVVTTNGTALIIGGTNIVYTPSTNFNGTNVMTYTITDGHGGSNSATITVEVDPVNDAPIAVNDSFSVFKNHTLSISAAGVLTNDIDVDGDALTAIQLSSTTNGSLTFSNDGSFIYIPVSNYFGPDTFTYQVTDGALTSAVATVTINILATNSAPIAISDVYTTAEDIVLTIPATGVLANDADADGDVLTAILNSTTTHGSLTLSSNGGFVYRPATNFNGTDTFTYHPNDGALNGNIATVTITVTPVNDLPIAVNDSATTPEDTAVTIPVLLNDTDVDGDPLTIIDVSSTNGTANIVGTNVVYTPSTNFNGTNVMTYTIIDGNGGTNSANITVVVTPVNDAPVAVDDSASTFEDTAVTIPVLVNDYDVESNTLSITGATTTNGTVSVSGTNVVFTPATNFAGTVVFPYTISDGHGGSDTGLVTVAVTRLADVRVTKSGPASVVAFSNFTYTVSVTNAGPSTASNVVVSDVLPQGFVLVSANPATASLLVGNTLSWSGFTLAENRGTNLTVTVTTTNSGTYTNMAYGSSDTPDPIPGNNDGSATNALVTTTVLPNADISVTKTGITNVMAGVNFDYLLTVSNAGPSIASSVVVTDALPAGVVFVDASSSVVVTNGNVLWTLPSLNPGSYSNLTLTAVGMTGGSKTNIARAGFPGFDPVTNNNNGSLTNSRVVTTVITAADVAVIIGGPTNLTKNVAYTNTVTVTNMGPATAASVVVRDFLPTNVTFVSATGGGVLTSNVVTWPTIPLLPNGGSQTCEVVLIPTSVGVITNVTSATSTTADPNLANNNGSVPASQYNAPVNPAFVGITINGTIVFNPQTGLFEERVTVTNIGNVTFAALRLYATVVSNRAAPFTITLQNAAGTNNGTPYVQYDAPLDPSNSVQFVLEFYDPTRVAFTTLLQAEASLPPPLTTNSTGSVSVDRIFADNSSGFGTRVVLEFTSTPGAVYTVIYSDDIGTTWRTATPSITAVANRTQWIDDGPPKTVSSPMSVNSRIYRIIRAP